MDNSAFSSRLGTNYAATEQEIPQLVEFLLEPTKKLAQLKHEVERAHQVYTDLCNQHEALSRQIEAHRALMAPMRRLSVDVVREIFLQCLPTEHNSLMSKHTAPMLLTQVCSGWRSIAHSTPPLWASIHIVLPQFPVFRPPPTLVIQNRARGVKEWLGRSGACLLDISIYNIKGNHMTNVTDACHEIIDSLFAVSVRWNIMELHIAVYFLERFAALALSDVPMLRAVSVDAVVTFLPEDWLVATSLWNDSGFLKAPRLRKISCNTVDTTEAAEEFAKLPLNWSQLTTIDFSGSAGLILPESSSSTTLMKILRSCAALVNCTLDWGNPRHENYSARPGPDLPLLSLPFLEQLSVQSHADSLCSLFHVLEAPALQNLEFFTHNAYRSDRFGQQLLSFLAHSDTGAKLRQLAFSPWIFGKEQVFKLIEACPNVSTLCLKNHRYETFRQGLATSSFFHGGMNGADSQAYDVGDDFLHSLSGATESALQDDKNVHGVALLQKLSTFECLIGGNISDEAILDFVSTKCRRVSSKGVFTPLRRVTIALYRPRTMKSMIDQLRPFAADGLRCEISYALPTSSDCYLASQGIPAPHESEFIKSREFLEL